MPAKIKIRLLFTIISIAAALTASFSAAAAKSSLIISLQLSEEEPMADEPIEVTVSVFSGKPYRLLTYPDENKLGGNGFLSVEVISPTGEKARFIHASKFLKGVTTAPEPKLIGLAKPHTMLINLRDWYEIKTAGEYTVSVRYRLFGEGFKSAAAITNLVSTPLKFKLCNWTPKKIKLAIQTENVSKKLKALKIIADKNIKYEGLANDLLILMGDENENLRAYAANCLGVLGDKNHFYPIMKTLLENPPQESEAIKAYQRGLILLVKHSKKLQNRLGIIMYREASKDGANRSVLLVLLTTAFNAGAENAGFGAAQLLEADDPQIQKAAIECVGKSNMYHEVARLAVIYRNSDNSEIKAATLSAMAYFAEKRKSEFGFYGDEDAISVFIDALQSKDTAVLSTASRYAGLFDDARLVDYLLPLLRHPNWVIRKNTFPSIARTTGCKLPYRFDASPREFEYQVAKWEEWWRENRILFFQAPPKDMLSWVLTVFSLLIILLTVGYILGFIRDSSMTTFLGGGRGVRRSDPRIFGGRNSELSRSRTEPEEEDEL